MSGQFAVDGKFLRHDAQQSPRRHLSPMRLSVEGDFALGRPQNARQHTDCGGFACSVGAEQPEDFALPDVEGNVIYGNKRTVGFSQMPCLHQRVGSQGVGFQSGGRGHDVFLCGQCDR